MSAVDLGIGTRHSVIPKIILFAIYHPEAQCIFDLKEVCRPGH